jgi:hypothetical protein
MNNNLAKYSNLIKIVLAVVGVISCLFLFGIPNVETVDAETTAGHRDGAKMGFATIFTIVILFACMALILVFFFTQLISNPKKTIMSIIGIVVSLVIYLIFYAAGTKDTDVSLGLVESVGNISKGTINSTTAGLWTVFIGLAIGFIVIVMGAVQRFLKR